MRSKKKNKNKSEKPKGDSLEAQMREVEKFNPEFVEYLRSRKSRKVDN